MNELLLKEKIQALPDKPGVYKFINKSGKIIYVGKAKSLKKRVKSYFLNKKNHPDKVQKLLEKIYDIETSITASQEEALYLEDELIKNYQPAFNILLRDDKTYPFIYISTHEKFPRVLFSHRAMSGEGKYYGPYPGSRMIKTLLTQIRKKYPYRDCSVKIGAKKHKKSCLYDPLGLCTAPCVNKDTESGYNKIIKSICDFLDGKQKKMIDDLYDSMMIESRAENFEKAASLKEQWLAAKSIFSKSMVSDDAWQRNIKKAHTQLKGCLGIRQDIRSIEAYDISNISGRLSVGVSVMFEDGRPYKKAYRRFRIKTVTGADDFAMMREVLVRRFKRILAGGEKMPDLILIDGGRGHLTASIRALNSLGMKSYNIAALAKKEELVYIPGREAPIILGRHSYVRKLLQAIRDEAHRFAIKYHRTLRAKGINESVLDEIPGVGPVIKRKLLIKYGSVKRLKAVTADELAGIKGINKKLARSIASKLLGIS